MRRFTWGILIGFAVGLLAFANPGGVRTTVVGKLQQLFGMPVTGSSDTSFKTLKGTWDEDHPPVVR